MSPIRRALYYAAPGGCIPNKKAEPQCAPPKDLGIGDSTASPKNRGPYLRVRSFRLFPDLRFHHRKPSTTTTTQMRILSSMKPLTSLRAYLPSACSGRLRP